MQVAGLLRSSSSFHLQTPDCGRHAVAASSMAVGIRAVAVVTAVVFLLSFLSILKVFHTSISGELNPEALLFRDTVQNLQYQLTTQKEQYAGLQRQLQQLELHLRPTAALTTGTGIQRYTSLRNGSTPTHEGGWHKLAVLVPYRDRQQHLAKLVPKLQEYLTAQGRAFTIFVIEQSPEYLFNRGALLNAGFQLLQGSDYDYFAFQDVDTVPTDRGTIQYSFPVGNAPLHLTPFRIHPAANFQDFFGGITIFTREQYERVNGYGTNFWGWGREDDNMRHRLLQHSMFPPELPAVPKKTRRYYFEHQKHEKALEWRVTGNGSEAKYHGVNPDEPYGDARIVSVQPHLMQETSSGLNSTVFWITNVQTYGIGIRYTVRLFCDPALTPWCEYAK